MMDGDNATEPPAVSFPTLSDETLQLPDGRNLAYRICGATDTTGNPTRRPQLVFALHGALGTGDFDLWSPLFQKLGWLVVAPTLPGWGMSSAPISSGGRGGGYTLQQYAEYDMAHLARHIVETRCQEPLHGEAAGISSTDTSFWCLGISYGCVHAIACAVHLPPGQVSGLCLLGPHGPFDDRSFNPLQGMALPSRVGLGFMGFHLPWLTRFTAKMVQQSVSTAAKARHFVKANLLDAMNDAEKTHFAAAPAELRDKISSGQGLHDSMCMSIQGYVDIPTVLRSWSVEDLKKVTCPTLLFVAKGDVQTPAHGARFIHEKLVACSKKKLTVLEEGGHMTLVFQLDACIEAFATWMSEQ